MTFYVAVYVNGSIKRFEAGSNYVSIFNKMVKLSLPIAGLKYIFTQYDFDKGRDRADYILLMSKFGTNFDLNPIIKR